MNRVVARYRNGQRLKGFTNDFLATKSEFHLFVDGSAPGSKPRDVKVAELKALFFVKDLAGDPGHHESILFSKERAVPGRKIRVVFEDGEVLLGTTQGYDASRPGFFIIPADATSNNERCFVVRAATREVTFV
jgi:hypothetical protein